MCPPTNTSPAKRGLQHRFCSWNMGLPGAHAIRFAGILISVEPHSTGWMDGWMDGWTDGRRDGWMDGWKDGRTDGWMDGWMPHFWECFGGSRGLCQCYSRVHRTEAQNPW